MSAKTIAFISKKGGVGKTTSAVSLAAALCERGRRVLLVDLDPQAGASLSLGVDRAALAPSVADVLLRGVPAREAVRPTRVNGLDLLTASVDLASLEEESEYLRSRETTLGEKLEAVRKTHDLVLVDCPPSFTLLTRNAVATADGYVVPAVPHFLAVEGVAHLVASVDRLRTRCRVRTRLLGILPTMVDYRTRLTRDVIEQIRNRFGNQVFGVEIRINVRLAEAPAEGKTIFQYDPRSTGAEAYRLAAEELLLRLQGERPVPTAEGEEGPGRGEETESPTLGPVARVG